MLAFQRTFVRESFKCELEWACKSTNLRIRDSDFLLSLRPLCLSLLNYKITEKNTWTVVARIGDNIHEHIAHTTCSMNSGYSSDYYHYQECQAVIRPPLKTSQPKRILAFSCKSPEKDFLYQNSQKNRFWLIGFLVSRWLTYDSFPVDIISLSRSGEGCSDCRSFRPRMERKRVMGSGNIGKSDTRQYHSCSWKGCHKQGWMWRNPWPPSQPSSRDGTWRQTGWFPTVASEGNSYGLILIVISVYNMPVRWFRI